MAASDDSRPFTILKQNAEDFKASFDEDVTQCLAVLDSKITELLCDQESSLISFGEAKRLNAHMEFSKAKLDIFTKMKELLNEMVTSWVEQLSELKFTFVENIEIFLASTKLEVKEDSLSCSVSKKSLSSLKRKAYQNSPSSSTLSSIYPSLLNTAKNIPVINSFLGSNEQEHESRERATDFTSQNIKQVRKLPTTPALKDTPGQNARRKNSVRFVDVEPEETIVVDDDDVMEEDDEIVVVQTPVQKRGRSRKPAINTPTSLRKALATRALQKEVIEIAENDNAGVETPVRSGRGTRKSILSTPKSLPKSQVDTPLRRRNAVKNETDSSDSSSGDDKPNSQAVAAEPEIKTKRGAKTLVPTETAMNVTPGRQQRTPAKRKGRLAAKQAAPEPEEEVSESDTNKVQTEVGPRTPKNVHFSLGLDIHEDLDIYSPEVDLSRSAPRRKTTVNPVLDTLPDLYLTPNAIRTKSKRKTIGGDLIADFKGAPSPKRLKSASRSSLVPSALAMEINEIEESDLLDSDEAPGKDNYTSWIPLCDVGAKVPTHPGIYELKVAQAKKCAYIGSCESLRQKLTLHKLKHNSGHKHLDKFVERNAVNILVRYEKMPSIAEAKLEEKTRVKNFVSQYNTTPAYN